MQPSAVSAARGLVSRRFAGCAVASAANPDRGVTTGLPFDPVARRFVEPDQRLAPRRWLQKCRTVPSG